MQPLVSVVVLNWNGKDHIEECLGTLFKQSYKNYEVIVVDNGSEDGSNLTIKNKFPKAKLIENSKNLGFCKANNQGIKLTKGKYVITLNNDTKLDKDWLKELVKVAEENPETGMFSCKMLFYDKPSHINSRGLKLYYDAKAVDEGFDTPDSENEEIKEVFGPCGGAAFFSKELIDDISLDGEFYDEDFFIYSDDLDVSFRARWRGWKCLYVPKSKLYHKFQGTTGKISNFGLYYGIKNKMFFIIKNYPLTTMVRYSPVIVSRQLVSFIYYLLKLNPAAFKSRMMILYKLPKMLRKRYKIQSTKKVPNKELKKWLLSQSLLKSIFSS
ncbi:MAG: glycosyl transferase [Nanoarchaeota archaeon]|nr:glycosyl transferase [Nanoarchaeota archaeon]